MKLKSEFMHAGWAYLGWIAWFCLISVLSALGLPKLNAEDPVQMLLFLGATELCLILPSVVYFIWRKTPRQAITGSVPTLKQILLVAAMAILAVPSLIFITLFSQGVLVALGGKPIEASIPIPDNLPQLVLAVLCVGVSAAAAEEPLFRSIQFAAINGIRGPKAAVLLTALFFALAHGSPESLPTLLIAGAILGCIRWRTGSLWLCMLFHAVYNSASVTLEFLISKLSGLVDPGGSMLPQMTALNYFFASGAWLIQSIPFIGLLILCWVGLNKVTPKEHKMNLTGEKQEPSFPQILLWAVPVMISLLILGSSLLVSFGVLKG